tara:strand:+ start:1926 stop:2141 length:216 start_codon:yes stop_codon:yes gene_type:complete
MKYSKDLECLEKRVGEHTNFPCGLCGKITYYTYSNGVPYQICENMDCPLTDISLTAERHLELIDYIVNEVI